MKGTEIAVAGVQMAAARAVWRERPTNVAIKTIKIVIASEKRLTFMLISILLVLDRVRNLIAKHSLE
jgi:hypothetical protein